MSVGFIKNGEYVVVAGLAEGGGKGGTGIYVQENQPDEIKTEEHWFKIINSLNSSDYNFLLSNLTPSNVKLTNLDEAVSIKWSDPSDNSWTGTKLMRMTGTTRDSWTLLEDVKTKNKYSTTGYVDTGLTNGTEYIYGIFPYNATEENRDNTYRITPSEIKPNALTNIRCEAGTDSLTSTFDKDNTVTRVVLIYKKGGIPTSSTDGTTVDNFTSGTPITGLNSNTTYGLRFYVYNEKGRLNDSMSMSITATTDVEKVKYTITYVLNGGTNSANNPAYITESETITLWSATKTNNTFDGWYTDSSYTNKVETLSNVNSNITLYAKFTEIVYKITYVLYSGVNSASNPNTIKYSDTITLANASKDGYNFMGWYLDSGFSSKITTLSKVTSNITLYAKFTEIEAVVEKTYLYDYGNECTSITGGWLNDKYYKVSGNVSSTDIVTTTKESDNLHLYIAIKNTTGNIMFYTSKTIDLSSYSRIGIKYKYHGNGAFSSLASIDTSNWYNMTTLHTSFVDTTEIIESVNAVNVNGSGKHIAVTLGDFTGDYEEVQVYQIWLERDVEVVDHNEYFDTTIDLNTLVQGTLAFDDDAFMHMQLCFNANKNSYIDQLKLVEIETNNEIDLIQSLINEDGFVEFSFSSIREISNHKILFDTELDGDKFSANHGGTLHFNAISDITKYNLKISGKIVRGDENAIIIYTIYNSKVYKFLER